MLKILGRSSSINVRKVLWTCAELDIDFEREDWGNGYRSTHSPEFLALNPNAMVPVIIDEDVVLWESNAIIRYLASSYGGQALYPACPKERAPVDCWLDWQIADLNPAWSYAVMALVRASPDHRDPALIRQSATRWTHYMRVLEQRLTATGAWVAGDDFSLADISIGLSVNRWFLTPIERPELPAVAEYYRRLNQRPGYRAYGSNGQP